MPPLHDVQRLGQKGADKRENHNAGTADCYVKTEKSYHRKNEKSPKQTGVFFCIFHAGEIRCANIFQIRNPGHINFISRPPFGNFAIHLLQAACD